MSAHDNQVIIRSKPNDLARRGSKFHYWVRIQSHAMQCVLRSMRDLFAFLLDLCPIRFTCLASRAAFASSALQNQLRSYAQHIRL